MTFNKYKKYGDYHWREFERPSIYRSHALKVKSWITEDVGLDVGCGDGLITHLLGMGWSGLDADDLAVTLAQRHGVRAILGSIYELAGYFEAVYCGDVLEHLEYPGAALQAIANITSVLYLATPPRRGQLRPHHIYEWTALELPSYMAAHGWTLIGDVEIENDRIYGKFEQIH